VALCDPFRPPNPHRNIANTKIQTDNELYTTTDDSGDDDEQKRNRSFGECLSTRWSGLLRSAATETAAAIDGKQMNCCLLCFALLCF